VIRQNIHGNGEAQDVRTHDEDQDQDRCHRHDFTADGASDEHTAVGKRLHAGVGKLELANEPACIGRNETKEDDATYARYDAQDCKGLR
jgi:hypothetical protein